MQNIKIYSKHLIRRQRRLASKPLSDGPIRSTGRIVGTTSYMATCSPCSHKGMQRRRDKSRLQGAHMTSVIEQLDLKKYNFFLLTGFFFTCWLAARMQRWEGFCEDHRKIVRFFFANVSTRSHTLTLWRRCVLLWVHIQSCLSCCFTGVTEIIWLAQIIRSTNVFFVLVLN